jgi:hypothetical protein
VGRERRIDQVIAGRRARRRLERLRIGMKPQRRSPIVQRTAAEQRGGRRPERSVSVYFLRPHLATERDQLGEVGDGSDVL